MADVSTIAACSATGAAVSAAMAIIASGRGGNAFRLLLCVLTACLVALAYLSLSLPPDAEEARTDEEVSSTSLRAGRSALRDGGAEAASSFKGSMYGAMEREATGEDEVALQFQGIASRTRLSSQTMSSEQRSRYRTALARDNGLDTCRKDPFMREVV